MNAGLEAARPAASRWQGFWGRLILDRFHRIFAVLILFQFIQIFKDYWWIETYSVVYGVLAVTAFCELLFTRWTGLRLGLEAAAAVVLSAVYSPTFQWIGWPDNWRDGEEWNLFYEFHLLPLHPFFELAVGMVLIVHVMSGIGRSRSAAIAILITSIGVMATIDSFFPLELWSNIAWTVAAGLGWLVILHLREVRARHPDSWAAMSERPVELALPAVIVISLLLLSGIFMPRAPALLEDPYTIWSEAQGREVRSAAGEGGLLGGGSGPNPSNLSSQSGYSRDDLNIGGGFEFDYSPVMTVQTSRRSYWRGEAKTVYTGTGWADVRNPAAQLTAESETGFGIPGRAEDVETETITQTVTMLRDDRYPVLFGAGPVTRVGDLQTGGNARLFGIAEEWELRFNRPTRLETYTVESVVTKLDPDALRALGTTSPDHASIDLKPYLQLPESLPDRVKDLAAQVTETGTNDYDKAVLLEKYLKTTFPYNNKPDLSKRTSPDFTDAFLFEIMEGYCDYYSTAFVVMARSVGIPARWVKGYASGVDIARQESLPFLNEQDPDAAGTYTVRNADAHSWAEVYFEGYGWIPFEPTAGFSLPSLEVSADLPVTAEVPDETEVPEETSENSVSAGWMLPAAGAAILLAAAAVILLRQRRAVRLWKRIRYAGASPDQRIIRETERLIKFLKRRGLTREEHETMRESFRRWGDQYTYLRPELNNVLIQFERAKYGHDSGTEDDAKRFKETVARLRKAM